MLSWIIEFLLFETFIKFVPFEILSGVLHQVSSVVHHILDVESVSTYRCPSFCTSTERDSRSLLRRGIQSISPLLEILEGRGVKQSQGYF